MAPVPQVFDDREQEWEITIEKYRSPILEELRWRNWVADTEGLRGDRPLDFINNKLFPSLKGLAPEATPRDRVILDVLEDAYQYMRTGTSSATCPSRSLKTCRVQATQENTKCG